MNRYRLQITCRSKPVVSGASILIAPDACAGLGLSCSEPMQLRFGNRSVSARFEKRASLRPGEISMPSAMAQRLCIPAPLALTAYRAGRRTVSFGPLIGLLISDCKMDALLDGKSDITYCRYDRYAREVGALLVFFTARGLKERDGVLEGLVLECAADGLCRWAPIRCPVPRVVYDRCFGVKGRADGARVRTMLRSAGSVVLNSPVKVTKLQAFELLRPCPEMAPYLPYTAPLTKAELQASLGRYRDLYLKPDALCKGKGVYRLFRRGPGWHLKGAHEQGDSRRILQGEREVLEALEPVLSGEQPYLVQEGLALATYLGNRFDLRSLVQKDGRGQWQVSGMVARIAGQGRTVTSPRTGGKVASADRALRHAFPDRWRQILDDLEGISLRISDLVERHLGLCVELGLDLGVTQDGKISLIEVNGKPLRVSLERLRDPLISNRIHQHPIHYAAFLEMQGGSHA